MEDRMEKFYDILSECFRYLNLPMVEFKYNPKTLEYYSTELLEIEGNEYTIVVTEDGRVLYGEVEGDEFFISGTLGGVLGLND